MRRNVIAFRRAALEMQAGLGPHSRDVRLEPLLCLDVDDGADLNRRISGIADYAVKLLEELKATYTIDLYHDAGYLPDLGLNAGDFATYDGRLFERNNVVLNYHATVYQMGNSVDYHGYLYDVLLRHPGVVTLHDFFLSVYPYRGTRTGAEIRAAFRPSSSCNSAPTRPAKAICLPMNGN